MYVLLQNSNTYFHKVDDIIFFVRKTVATLRIILQFLRVSVDRFSHNGPFSQYIKHTDRSKHKKCVSYVVVVVFNVKMLTFSQKHKTKTNFSCNFLFSFLYFIIHIIVFHA